MFPLPPAANPIPVKLLVQLKTVLGIADPLNIIGAVLLLAHKICGLIASTTGVGLTRILNETGLPEQVLENGVTVI